MLLPEVHLVLIKECNLAHEDLEELLIYITYVFSFISAILVFQRQSCFCPTLSKNLQIYNN
jgi:hypothetical protein